MPETVTLKSSTLILRPPLPNDAAGIAVIANNEKIARHLRDIFPHPYSTTDAEVFIKLAMEGQLGFVWVIMYNDQLAGTIGLIPQPDIYRHSAEIGYWIGEPFWDKGIASEAVALVCTHAFEALGIVRLYAGVFATNEASQKVLLKNGFKLEGVKRKGVIKNGVVVDEMMMAKTI